MQLHCEKPDKTWGNWLKPDPPDQGYFLILTNDGYWRFAWWNGKDWSGQTPPLAKGTIIKAFRLPSGKVLASEHSELMGEG